MLVVELWLMDCFDCFLTRYGHVANLPEKYSKVTSIANFCQVSNA